ncbi:hypothetical protein [Halotalea alkalilenta]|uniref:Lipid/polyisoprenoid-binding YceI-like domain-containing protein n=1 Tax=Halotalea alkalilenta TaxID=376489 RepID=A0A172YH55_9GAMM|nr:hypothetical protein [Halotalea alkalilenta]ANF58527.1 hypothetical protein A5892_14455 [Halotalea alkalilenta]
MRRNGLIAGLLGIGFSLAFSAHAEAAWRFDPMHSYIDATLTDQRTSGDVVQQHRVERLAGTIDEQGQLTLPLALDQLDLISQLPSWLSGLATGQVATITAEVDPGWFNALGIGESATRQLPLTIQGERFTRHEEVALALTRVGENEYRVRTAEPVSIDTRELMQLDNAQTILAALGFQRLSDTIPISFDARLLSD